MSAIRNVGELASPYYLIEVWARREDIDIDPETFATLKRKARALVRDARAFELREEEPDEDWRGRRRDLLAIDSLHQELHTLDDGAEFELGVWCESSGPDALLVGDLHGFDDPDQRGRDMSDPAATQFELALDAYRGDADWGLLLAGLQVRVYRRSSGISQQYLALDLDTLVELDDDPSWKAFAAMFRGPAFAGGPDGIPLIRRVVDESRRHASALAADMRRDVVDAAESLLQGILTNPANADLVGHPTRSRLHELFEESLYVLYRVLFVLYAESRDVLPVGGRGAYGTSYSLDHLVELARRGGARRDGSYFDETLKTLFALLWNGPSEMTTRLGFEPVGGELFDPDRTPVFTHASIADSAWERALTSVALGAPDSPRRRLGRRSSFAELGVDQLGSIYEGLLVLEPYLATEAVYLGSFKGERRVFADPNVDGFNVYRHLSPGDFVLESAGGRRKGSGSFYTPHEITEYLTHAAVDPIVDAIVGRAALDPGSAATEILELKVCDPAMGSGAFLVQAARTLAMGLARVRALRGDGLVTPDRVQQAKREVVRHCLYGVDLNPLAVVLAKVSLWLETLEPGRPLSFLDAHLRCGNSLVGVDFATPDGQFTAADLAAFPANATKGLENYLVKEAGEAGKAALGRAKNRKKPKAAAQAQLPGLDRSSIEGALEALAEERQRIALLEEGAETLLDALSAQEAFAQLEEAEDSIRNRLRRAADFFCAQWFSNGEDAIPDAHGPVVPASAGDFEQIVAALVSGASLSERLQTQVDAADRVSRVQKFFHWALEFPEVFFERGGFDVVLGNPPWNNTSPNAAEFFGAYDPTSFKKGSGPQIRASAIEALRRDVDIDQRWRSESRILYELTAYASEDSGRYSWHADEGELRKGHPNVFRLFVERAAAVLRPGGRCAQVLPEGVYQLGQAAGLRHRLLEEHRLDFCYVFENRKGIFPIHRSVKVTLLGFVKGDGPTESFRAFFAVGKDPSGRSRAVSVEELPQVLVGLDSTAAHLLADQVRMLAPRTLAFPELITALDAEIATTLTAAGATLGSTESGWTLEFSQELNVTKDNDRFVDHAQTGVDDRWLPVLAGENIYHLESRIDGDRIGRWISRRDFMSSPTRRIGTQSVSDFPRVAWRDVASATNERTSIATVVPPDVTCDHTLWTFKGGTLTVEECAALAAVMSSFCFDYLVRLRGRSHVNKAIVLGVTVPKRTDMLTLAPAAAAVLRDEGICAALHVPPCGTDPWELGEARGRLDAAVAVAYGLSLHQFAAVLAGFPNLDLSQPMLPSEPKCFVTRDLALAGFCEITGTSRPDLAKLMREIGSGLPDPRPEFRDIDMRLAAYRDLGAVPYRPTPRGARTPTDPAAIEEVLEIISDGPLAPDEIAAAMGEDVSIISAILKNLRKAGEIYSEGRGKTARYYRLEED